MKRLTFVTLISLAAVLTFSGVVLATGVPVISVKPLNPDAGQEITVSGTDLGVNSKVEVRLIGNNVNLVLGGFNADGNGRLTAKVTLPATLTPGTYLIKATGGESASVQLTIAAAGAPSNPADETMGPAPTLKQRPLNEVIIALVIFGVLAGLGILLAQRQARHPQA